jgi:1-acyl-sn-glycerol-3-phosphate acyltransferase
MIRFIFVCITVIGFLILSIPALIVEWIIGKFNPERKDFTSLHLVKVIFSIVLKITGVTLTVIGEENVPVDQPVLYIGNHRSFFDVLLTYTRVPGRCGYIAKYEMRNIPLLNNWMHNLHCLFLDRKDLKQGMKTILAAIDKIKQGISITIFPEGTRNRNADECELLPFHEGSFRIATKTGCPIIPVSLNNTAEIFESHFPSIGPCHVILEYGKPIYPKELSREEQKHLGAYTREIIQSTLLKNKDLI